MKRITDFSGLIVLVACIVAVLAMIASCGAAVGDRTLIEVHGWVVADTRSVVSVSGSGYQYEGTGRSNLTTMGNNIPHLLVTYSSHTEWAMPERVMLVKIEDQKGASLVDGDFVRLLCLVDLGEKVGPHALNSVENGYEVQDCRLITPYVDGGPKRKPGE